LSKNAQLQAIANSSCLCSFHFVVFIANAKPCQNYVKNLCGMEQSNAIARLLILCYIFICFNNKFKALNALFNSAEYIP
jgi:hypothetical protein